MKMFTTTTIVALILSTAVARADVTNVSVDCDIAQKGKRYEIYGTNPNVFEVNCTITCLFRQTDGKPFPAQCSGGLARKSTHQLICSNQVDGTLQEALSGSGSCK